MSIPFNEIVMPDKPKTKGQILEEMKRTLRYRPVYVYDGGLRGEMAHAEAEMQMAIQDEYGFEDLPF
jgi:hypothetical protein